MTTKWPKITDMERTFGRMSLDQDGTPSDSWKKSNLVQFRPSKPLRAAWNPEQAVHKITCNKMCRAAMSTAIEETFAHYGNDQSKISAAGLDRFVGSFFIDMVNGQLSPHAYGAAIRLDCEPSSEVISIFEKQGAVYFGGSFMFASLDDSATQEIQPQAPSAEVASEPAVEPVVEQAATQPDDDAKKAAMRERMAKARAGRKPKGEQ